MLSAAKLTKRQKKGIAFRERKHGKGIESRALEDVDDLENENDVDSLKDQVLANASQGTKGSQVSAEPLIGKAKQRREGKETEGRVVAAKKREREAEEEARAVFGESEKSRPKRRKGVDGDPVVDMEQPLEDRGDEEGRGKKEEKSNQRFILFLGNLKYTTTIEAIQAHFSACDPPPAVRLLTPKPSSTKPVTKSKGCAFLEFKHRNALQQGLKLHHSQLDGRQINVELTAGGGGKGEARTKKLKERNKGLDGQRRKRQEKGPDHSKVKASPTGGAQRFSATSGTEQVPTHKRTWTVGDAEETEIHRGGRRQQRGAKSQVKDFRTGVNAIPIG